MSNPINEVVKSITDSGDRAVFGPMPSSHEINDKVEWVLAHKTCGRRVEGLSGPRCDCLMSTGMPPGVKQIMGWGLEDCVAASTAKPVEQPMAACTKCETAEKEITKLTEKLDKASKRIAELMKNV